MAAYIPAYPVLTHNGHKPKTTMIDGRQLAAMTVLGLAWERAWAEYEFSRPGSADARKKLDKLMATSQA